MNNREKTFTNMKQDNILDQIVENKNNNSYQHIPVKNPLDEREIIYKNMNSANPYNNVDLKFGINYDGLSVSSDKNELERVNSIKSKNSKTTTEPKTNFSNSNNQNSYIHVENNIVNEVNVDNYNENQVFTNNLMMEKKSENDEDYIIQIRNIHKSYLIGAEGVPALRGVTLKIKHGEFLVILGTSGGGKTTLLNVLGTIDAPTRGDVRIFESNIKSNSEDSFLSFIRLKEVAFVFQSFNLLSNMNVVENVELPMKILGELSTDEIRKRAVSLLEKVGLGKRLWHFPNQLSGGEQQRVTIARALSNRPKILLLDEPTGDLDTKNSDIVMNILLELNMQEKITMIMVTHDVALKTFGNRVVRMMDGKVQTSYDIDVKEREEHIERLQQRVLENKFELREGAQGETGDGKTKNTYIRKLQDYKIILNRFKK